MAGQVARRRAVGPARAVQLVDLRRGDVDLPHAGPARVGGQLGAVLLRGQADGGSLDPQRQVLADQHDGVALGGQAARHRQDPGVVIAEPEPGRQDRRVGVVQLDPQGAAPIADRQVGVQPAVGDPEVVQVPERLPGEVAEFRMVPFGLQLGDDHDRQDDPVLGEPADGARISQQDAGVEDVCEPGTAGCADRIFTAAG
jgi:hypothetical protein